MMFFSSPVLLLFLLVSISGYTGTETNTSVTIKGGIEGTVQLAPNTRVIRKNSGLYGRSSQTSAAAEPTDSVLVILTGGPVSTERSTDMVSLNQRDRRFIPDLLAVDVGQTVRIQNSDPVYHNVFSLTRPHKFDVGRRPMGEFFDITFDEPGVIDVFCDIHSNMHAIIYVLPPSTVAWAKVKSGESFRFTDIPDGAYQILSYAKGYEQQRLPVEVSENTITQTGQITLNP